MADRDHTLFLLDGMALAYRAHFALATNPIRTASGRVTSGIYGFANTLLDLINRFNPTHLAVVFDTDAPTARHQEFEAYKAQRNAMPEELSQALPDIKRLIRAFNFPVIELDGYEADDLIATLARKAEPAGFTTYMVTPDKDFGQLVTEHILQYRPSRMGDNPETLGVAQVLAKWGIERVDQVRDILGFAGDTSDNIPGVPGVGPKTAQKLVAQYGTLENALDHASEQKGKLGESLVKFREQALLSKKLVTLDSDAPIAFEPDTLRATTRRSRRSSWSSSSIRSAGGFTARSSRRDAGLPRRPPAPRRISSPGRRRGQRARALRHRPRRPRCRCHPLRSVRCARSRTPSRIISRWQNFRRNSRVKRPWPLRSISMRRASCAAWPLPAGPARRATSPARGRRSWRTFRFSSRTI
jgi:5'-3' exonuclease